MNYIFKSIIVLISISMIGCAQNQEREQEQENEKQKISGPQKAVALVHPTEGNEVSGHVIFAKAANGVQVTAELTGLDEGKHGFHIHEYGDCTASDGTSAGGHYNPTDDPHAGPDAEERHMGDMGNIEADENGEATLDYIDDTIKLGGPNHILGRGIVLHGGTDDLESQPSGAAGPRVGCGVIGIANPDTN